MCPSGIEQLWNEMRFSVVCRPGWHGTAWFWHKMAAVQYVCGEGGYGG